LSSHLAVASTITPTSNSPDPSPRSRPNRSSSPPSIGRDQRTSLAEALTHSAPTRLSRRPHKQQPPSAIHTHPKAAQDTNQPSSPPQGTFLKRRPTFLSLSFHTKFQNYEL
jgi:hypothetical protein